MYVCVCMCVCVCVYTKTHIFIYIYIAARYSIYSLLVTKYINTSIHAYIYMYIYICIYIYIFKQGTRFTFLTGTKVQMLTQKGEQRVWWRW